MLSIRTVPMWGSLARPVAAMPRSAGAPGCPMSCCRFPSCQASYRRWLGDVLHGGMRTRARSLARARTAYPWRSGKSQGDHRSQLGKTGYNTHRFFIAHKFDKCVLPVLSEVEPTSWRHLCILFDKSREEWPPWTNQVGGPAGEMVGERLSSGDWG